MQLNLLDRAIPIRPPFWTAPGLEWFRIGECLIGFCGPINGVRHCVVGDDRAELGRLSLAIHRGDA